MDGVRLRRVLPMLSVMDLHAVLLSMTVAIVVMSDDLAASNLTSAIHTQLRRGAFSSQPPNNKPQQIIVIK